MKALFFQREVPIIYEYKIPIKQNYEELVNSYNNLKKDVDCLVAVNQENPKYQEKIKFNIDKSVIDNNNFFAKYEVEIKDRIDNKLNKFYLLDQENLAHVFKLRMQLVEFNNEILSMDTVGTALNYLREFYKDVELDIEQNRIINDRDEKAKKILKEDIYKGYIEELALTGDERKISKETIKSKEMGWVVNYGG